MSLYTVKKLYHDPFDIVQHILTEVFITLCKVSLYIVMLTLDCHVMHVVSSKRRKTLENTESITKISMLKSMLLIFNWSNSVITLLLLPYRLNLIRKEYVGALCPQKQMRLVFLRWMRNKLLHKIKVNVILYMPLNWYIYSSRFFVFSKVYFFMLHWTYVQKTLCKNHDHKSGDRIYTVSLISGCLYTVTWHINKIQC